MINKNEHVRLFRPNTITINFYKNVNIYSYATFSFNIFLLFTIMKKKRIKIIIKINAKVETKVNVIIKVLKVSANAKAKTNVKAIIKTNVKAIIEINVKAETRAAR